MLSAHRFCVSFAATAPPQSHVSLWHMSYIKFDFSPNRLPKGKSNGVFRVSTHAFLLLSKSKTFIPCELVIVLAVTAAWNISSHLLTFFPYHRIISSLAQRGLYAYIFAGSLELYPNLVKRKLRTWHSICWSMPFSWGLLWNCTVISISSSQSVLSRVPYFMYFYSILQKLQGLFLQRTSLMRNISLLIPISEQYHFRGQHVPGQLHVYRSKSFFGSF